MSQRTASPKKILFFTPLGGISGSELLLLRTLQHADSKIVKTAVFCEKPGVMGQMLPPDVPFFTNPFQVKGLSSKWLKLKNALSGSVYIDYLKKIQASFQADYWYLNTIMMAHVAPIAQELGVPLISHFHELPHIHFEPVAYEHLKSMIEQSVCCIGNAEITCEKLQIMGAKQIGKVYPFVEFEKIKTDSRQLVTIRERLNIPTSAFVWVIAGAPTYAKGIEHLPTLAAAFPNDFFVWIGKDTRSGSFYFTEQEMVYRKLQNVRFVGLQTSDYYHYLGLGNGLLLLSREESFGMVNLEALQLGMPVVAFPSGGVSEIVQEGMGKVISSWNVSDFITAMKQVKTGEIPFDATKALKHIAQFNQATQMAAWHQIIQSLP
ncbi:MAG: glycosyltransferase [Spirosomataceae bacterium]